MNVIYAQLMNEEHLFGFVCPKKQGQLETPAGESSSPDGKKKNQKTAFHSLTRLSAGLDKRCPQSRDFLAFSLMFNHIFRFFLSNCTRGFFEALPLPAKEKRKRKRKRFWRETDLSLLFVREWFNILEIMPLHSSCQELDKNIDTALKDNYSQQRVSIAQRVETGCS